jgi:protein-tyrosine kinase
MSKIYEALLRAEQERQANVANRQTASAESVAVADVNEVPAPPPVQPLAAALAAVPPAASAEFHAAVETYEPVAPSAVASSIPASAFVEPVYVVPAGAPRLDVAAIRTTRWQPVMEKMPAIDERGAAVEQFRSLRTRLFGFRENNNLKSVMISSGLPREGKSFIALNLAVSFARHKAARVLLIDGDMRRSSLHSILGCEKSPGLTTYLAGKASIAEIMQRPELRTDGKPLTSGLATLTFIGGGDEGDLAADLAGSDRFRQLIDTAAPYFDWIVVDSSPVNLVTDSVNLAAACDAVLMVARGGVTRFEAAQRALGELKAAKILGVVLNAVENKPGSEGYYGYGYGAYDGYDPVKTAAEPVAT